MEVPAAMIWIGRFHQIRGNIGKLSEIPYEIDGGKVKIVMSRITLSRVGDRQIDGASHRRDTLHRSKE